MEEFYLKVYLFKPNRVPPIKIAKDSQLKITIETMDYTIPPGATASAFANCVTSEKVYTQSCTVSGNKVSFTPVPGFFVRGRNLLQYEIAGGVIPLAIDVNCEISLPTTGETAEPETVRPLVQRAEAAAATAEEKANAAAGSAQAAQEALEKNQAISVNPSYIGDNGNWFVWDIDQGSYVDSGVKAQGPKGDPGAVQRVCGVAPDAAGNVALTAENVGAATPEQLNAAVRKAAPRNLLDNSDFRNPVNQRGQTSYAGNGGLVYAIDRWLTYSAYMTVSVQDGYLSINNNSESEYAQFSQIVSGLNVIGKTFTVAAWDTNGRISCASGVMSEDWIVSVGNDYNIFCHTIENNCIIFSIAPKAYKTANILGVALYEGTYTAETLPEYQPKGYGAELAECQRYYQIRSTNNIAAVDMRPTMRLSSPTITSVTGGYAYSADL